MIDRMAEGSEPWFVLAHFMDPHEPYRRGGRDVISRYRREVEYLDDWLGSLFAELSESGRYERMLIVLTADHGEEIDEQRSTLHVGGERAERHGFSLYQELIRVPLIVKFPSGAAAGDRIQEPVSLVDIAPTILGVAGLQVPAGFRGVDLRTLLGQGARSPERTIFAGGLMEADQMLTAIRGDRKLVSPDSLLSRKTAVAFELAEDPNERLPIPLEDAHESFRALFDELHAEATVASPPELKGAEVELNPAQRRQLQELGYVE
jgi:hypothetical protein